METKHPVERDSLRPTQNARLIGRISFQPARLSPTYPLRGIRHTREFLAQGELDSLNLSPVSAQDHFERAVLAEMLTQAVCLPVRRRT